MKARVIPQYGFGWYGQDGPPALEVPRDFSCEIEVLEPGSPFKAANGQVSEPNHPLTGLWIMLWQRTMGDMPTYNLSAFKNRPPEPFETGTSKPVITGYALAAPISN